MTAGLVVHTDVEDGKGNSDLHLFWWFVRDSIELAAPHVYDEEGVDDEYNPIHGRQRKRGDGHDEEPLP
jgi:hypothetical protein